MKVTVLFSSIALGLLPSIIASSAPTDYWTVKPRALSDAPNGYAPVHVACPANRPTIRSASTLSTEETSWLDTRRGKTILALKDFFRHVEIDDFDASSYIESHSSNSSNLPNIGIAISGGGFRACLNGAGALKAFDSRTPGATAKGQIGGLLQSATYVAGLSGGSWAVASVFVNNFTSIYDLQENFWNFSSAMYIGAHGADPVQFWDDITAQVKAKKDAGFVTSSPDFWGRMQGYNFFNASDGGVDITWSSIAKTQAFKDGDMPLPLVVADGQYFNKSADEVTALNDPVYEFSPWEFGTFDTLIYGFAPLEYLGSRFVNGVVPDNETCVRGFDNAGFITGTSSDIWNSGGIDLAATLRQAISQTPTNTSEGAQTVELLSYAVKQYLSAVSSTNSTVNGPAAYQPNPFYQYNQDSFAQDTRLTVVDGGENNEDIPLNPLIQRKRNVDVIFAVDSGQDTAETWPNGTTLIATYERTLGGFANDTSFPSIPDANTFVSLGLNTRPVFFGCNSSNLTAPAPLIVYLPNHLVTYPSNVSMYVTNFDTATRDAIILNGYNVATQSNSTVDFSWSTCVGCSVLSRSFDRTGTPVPSACSQCFQHYCWNGTTDDQTVPSSTSPSASSSPTAHNMGSSLVPAAWSIVIVVGVILFTVI
ncbi:lysophospholipase phospholipase [Talaromyces proteolyticus]|uniref:Lysophospholipase n=1 Tax=Talaromyces proteolyticus TaxID=1131652 RepID=A0AAD4KXK6_9EURO|nr:lysophospholipase phospholipase [Talaromyces proteolyticus]KAH8703405.1 lysophospholipase phospholipase [Talaromyces proteolyticus]